MFEQIGDRDCQSIASHYVLQTKEALERRKRILKRQKGKKKSKGGSRGRREQRQEFRQGRLGNLHVSNSMMIRSKGNTPQSRKDKGQAQNTTWSPGLKRWYGVKASKAWSSTVVLENRHAREATGLNTRRNLYRTSGMAEQLNEHEGDLENFLKAVRPSFYTLEEYMVGGGMSDNECNDSITEYEDVEDDPFQPRQQPLLFGSTRHMKDLRQVSHSLLSKSASDPGADGAREEWAEWLRSHGMCQDDE